MRRLNVLVLCIATAIHCDDAFAGSLEDALRGSHVAKYDAGPTSPHYVPGYPTYFRWEGFYFGAQFSHSSAGIDFKTGTSSLINYILREDVVGRHVSDWTTLSKVDSSTTSFGGFIGYNMQWEQVVLSAELNYNRVSGGGEGSASDGMTRTFSDDTAAPAFHHYFYTASVLSSASARLTNFGTVRARAGYVMDRFMPYAFAGLAVGTVDVSRSATVSYLRRDIPDVTDPPTLPQPNFLFGPVTRTEQQNDVVAYGFAAGLGMDIALMPNLFVRGEWEYIQFAPVKDIKISVNTVRAGVALKF